MSAKHTFSMKIYGFVADETSLYFMTS